MRRVALAALLLIASGLHARGPVLAQAGLCGEDYGLTDALCGGQILSVVPGDDSGDSQQAVGSNSDENWQAFDRVTTGPNGEGCVGTGYAQAPPGIDIDGSLGLDTSNLLADYPPCPAGTREPRITPAMLAAQFWQRIPMPVPQPHIAPGRAITGKWAYLETNGEVRHVYTQDTIVGPLEIVATGAYYVDWGDGQTSGPHSTEGGPWPHGEIRHTYVWAGTVDVVVTEHWTATWRLGSASGNLRQLRTTGRIDDFPVQEIQAVRLN